MKKIKVNSNSCIGCGACIAIDSQHFDFNMDGKSSIISQEDIENNNDLINAIESCPVAAIDIVDEEQKCECEKNCTCNCQEEQECEDDCSCCESCNCGCEEK